MLGGRVVDERGRTVGSAEVIAEDQTGLLHKTRSDPEGGFHFAGLSPGDYRLAAQAEALSCDPLGPIPLSRGDDLRGLVLRLSSGQRLAGRVRDLVTREVVPGARLAVAGTLLVGSADADGRYAFSGVPSAARALTVQAPGYLTRTIELDGSPHARVGLDIFLQPGARLEGVVVRGDGSPAATASLWISRYQASSDSAEPLQALGGTTAHDGTFSVTVEPGPCRLVARLSGLAEGQSESLDVGAGQRRTGVRIALGVGGTIEGKVVSPSGSIVGSGSVTAIGGTGGWPVSAAPIAPDGTFRLMHVPGGRWTLSADAAQARGTAAVDLDEGGQAQVEIRLGDGTLEGTVLGADGRPVEGALVVARAVGLGEAGERSGLSGATGRFRLSGLSGDRFDVAASKDEGSAEVRGIPAGQRDVALSLAVGRVAGFVEAPDHAGITDFFLRAEPDVPGQGRGRSLHRADPRGEFELVLAPGSYTLFATAPGYAEGYAEGVKVLVGQKSSGVRIELRPSGTIDGVVRDAASGSPIAGVHLATDRARSWAVGRAGPDPSGTAISGSDGRFLLRDIPPGNWPVFASSAEYEATGPPPMASVQPGSQGAPIEIHMKRAVDPREQEYAGIGMSLMERSGHKLAAEIFPGGPAFEAGIRSGDELVTLDGASAQTLSLIDLVNRIRGPVGTEITVSLQRSDDGPSYQVVLPRAQIRFW
jgi:hypothetical protein